ncbi:uncharacterized protein LOC134260108 [Saccostrea cucullata]|uniref:uncharacterized protein LOC134260108 n=1 Tax=Saccostrea cuccullata TaxID=36930 RepID=UPI002ED38846
MTFSIIIDKQCMFMRQLPVKQPWNHYIMDLLGFSTQCKVRQCSQCYRDTEFYCNTCKQDLCLLCRNYDLDLNIYHDVVKYRERDKYIQKQEACVRHPDMVYTMYCFSCGLPICLQCTEHRKHKLLYIKTAFDLNRQQHRETFHRIRSETLYNSNVILEGIKTDIKIYQREISICQSEMITKAERLKNLSIIVINDNVCSQKRSFIHRLKHQKRKMKRNLASIETYEQRSEQKARTPVKFLLFLKNTRVSQIKDTAKIMQNIQLAPPNEDINMKNDIKLLSDIQIIETGKRKVRNFFQLKLMPSQFLTTFGPIPGVQGVGHISCSKEKVCFSDFCNNLILTNTTTGEVLNLLTDVNNSCGWGIHTMNINGALIYIDTESNINILSSDNKRKSLLVRQSKPWLSQCVYCSPSNGDLLVGMHIADVHEGRVNRYSYTGLHIQTIPDIKSERLYQTPECITENRNGDVIVSDSGRQALVVTERGGNHRFTYTGPGNALWPRGICTDELSNILVCDHKNDNIQMIDMDGHFLQMIETEKHGIVRPRSLSYDDINHLLWVGSWSPTLTNHNTEISHVLNNVTTLECGRQNESECEIVTLTRDSLIEKEHMLFHPTEPLEKIQGLMMEEVQSEV